MSDVSHIGKKLRKLRTERGLDLATLAEMSRLDEDILHRLESGHFLPSMALILKIARILDVRLGTFLDNDVEEYGVVVIRQGNPKNEVSFAGAELEQRPRFDFHPLATDKKGRHMEPFLIDVHPTGTRNHKFSTHEGEEFIYVLSGKLVIYHGNQRFSLSAGDSIYYDATVEHDIDAVDGDARILSIIYTPS